MESNLADLFESVVNVVADQTAVVCDGRRLSYAELEARASRLAHRLVTAGIDTGDRVGVQLANGPEYLEATIACLKIRAPRSDSSTSAPKASAGLGKGTGLSGRSSGGASHRCQEST